MKTTYYQIDEKTAKRAKEAYSFYDYKEGEATALYRSEVDKAAELAERLKVGRDEKKCEKIDYLLDRYACKLADWYNADNRNTASCPSILIAGGSNFPTKKKYKQNRRSDTLMQEWNDIQGLLDKMKSVAYNNAIYSDDENAVEKLKIRIDGLKNLQKWMKEINAYYRKHKTLEGCGLINDRQKAEILKGMAAHYWSDKPFPAYELTNNNANIHRLEKRLADLEAAKSAEPAETITGEGWELVENTENMRIQFLFNGKPDEETRSILKKHGFRWAPSVKAWQRQLNDNGKRAAHEVIQALSK